MMQVEFVVEIWKNQFIFILLFLYWINDIFFLNYVILLDFNLILC